MGSGTTEQGLLVDVNSLDAFSKELQNNLVVVHFWAPWCEPCAHMDAVMTQLAADYPLGRFLRVEAEEAAHISEHHHISAVPCFLIFLHGQLAHRLEGADPAALAAKVAEAAGKVAAKVAPASGAPPAAVRGPPLAAATTQEHIKQLISQQPIMLFMKGTPDAPQCGFSSSVVQALRECNAHFGTFDILTDPAVRAGIKTFSDWPTFPQLYVNGELVGGCDIVKEMKESGELQQLLAGVPGAGAGAPTAPSAANGSSAAVAGGEGLLVQRLEALVKSAPVMLFMKGDRSQPRCKFSRRVLEALDAVGASYSTFDILSDDAVREGMKKFSDWPTFPQLYVNGELVGGCDIVQEMKESGELKRVLNCAVEDLDTRLRRLVNSQPVMLFMKGTPDAPKCGFSKAVVEALRAVGQDFGFFDILSDQEVREGLKKWSDWPTYPQVYVQGELLGGCDIVKELGSTGELKKTIDDMKAHTQ